MYVCLDVVEGRKEGAGKKREVRKGLVGTAGRFRRASQRRDVVFCAAPVPLSLQRGAMSSAKPVVKICDMAPEMLEGACHKTPLARASHTARPPSPLTVLPQILLSIYSAALSEAEHAFTTFNTEKEVAQAVRNAFVKKVREHASGPPRTGLLLLGRGSDPPPIELSNHSAARP